MYFQFAVWLFPYRYVGSLLTVAMDMRLPQVAFILFWTPGLSVAILTGILNIPEDLAKLCVDPLKVFTFFGLTGDCTQLYNGVTMTCGIVCMCVSV